MTTEPPQAPASSRDPGALAAALASPALPRDLEYARGKAAVAAALFDEAPAAPTFGRYTVLRRLGAGGMGEVYAARDPVLGREVALKLARARPHADGSGDEGRLLREAQLLARVSHPNIVQIHEVGVVDGHIYIAMALIRGRDLREWQREAPRPWAATLRMYVAAARGLAAAHAAGLVHCDFKPDNVLVDTDEHVYLVDFGLARAADRPTTIADRPADAWPGIEPVTLSGPAGTPGYVAPEQLAGRPPDLRSDIFSLCSSLFEALHGWLPGRDPPRPRLTTHPRWVDRVLARGMSPDPTLRHDSLEALVAALENATGRRRRRLALVCALLAVGGLAGTALQRAALPVDRCAAANALDEVWSPDRRSGVAAVFHASERRFAADTWRRVDDEIQRYLAAWSEARRQLCEATPQGPPAQLARARRCLDHGALAVAALVERLASGQPDAIERSIAAVEALPPPALCSDPTTAGDPTPDRSAAEQHLDDALTRALITARAHAATGSHHEALRLASDTLARARRVSTPVLAQALLVVGELEGEHGGSTAAEAALLDAVDLAEAGRQDELAASGWLALTTLAARQQVDPGRARQWARRASAALDRIDDQGPRRAALFNALGVAAAHANESAEAERLHREAITRLEGRRGATIERLRAQQGLANALEALGRHDEARAAFDGALARAREQFGPDHPQYARVAQDMATLLVLQGEGPRARALLESALAIWTDAHGAASIECARVHTGLAHQAVQADELARAQHHGERALEIYRQVLPDDHEDLPAALINLGVIAFWRGDHEQALAAYREAQALQDRFLPAGHLHRAITANNIGESLLATGRSAAALASFATAEPIVRAAPTLDRELLAMLLRGKGTALQAQGQTDPARAALTEARALYDQLPGSAGELAELDERLAQLAEP